MDIVEKNETCYPLEKPALKGYDMDSSQPVKRILGQKSREVIALLPTATVFDAVKLMAEKSAGSVLVMKDEKLLGIVSERDCTRRALMKDLDAHKTCLQDIMTTVLLTVGADETADRCMNIMTEKHIRHLPVMDGEKVLGVVSIGDIVKWLVTSQEETIKHLENFITGSYPPG